MPTVVSTNNPIHPWHSRQRIVLAFADLAKNDTIDVESIFKRVVVSIDANVLQHELVIKFDKPAVRAGLCAYQLGFQFSDAGKQRTMLPASPYTWRTRYRGRPRTS